MSGRSRRANRRAGSSRAPTQRWPRRRASSTVISSASTSSRSRPSSGASLPIFTWSSPNRLCAARTHWRRCARSRTCSTGPFGSCTHRCRSSAKRSRYSSGNGPGNPTKGRPLWSRRGQKQASAISRSRRGSARSSMSCGRSATRDRTRDSIRPRG